MVMLKLWTKPLKPRLTHPLLFFPTHSSPQQPSKRKEDEVITISRHENRLPGKLHQFNTLIKYEHECFGALKSM